MKHMKKPSLVVIVLLQMMSGCDENRRIADLAEEELNRRAEETRQLGELHLQVQQERIELGQQRDQLEQDRRKMADQRHRDPILATALTSAVGLMAYALVLLVCWRILKPPSQPELDRTAQEILLSEFVSDEPLLLAKGSTSLPQHKNNKSK